jgi:hypothetical protein
MHNIVSAQSKRNSQPDFTHRYRDPEHSLVGWLVRRGVSLHRARLAVALALNLGRAA